MNMSQGGDPRHDSAAACDELIPARTPILRHVIHLWRKFRRWFSRREWTVKLLGLPVSRNTTDEPGLVLIQIDGLSRPELDRALKQNRLPFVRKLLERECYGVQTMYSGQPATTPAVLAELFYGVKQAVPAFGFRDHRSGEKVQMFQPGIAHTIQQELEQKGEPLLRGGTTYCDIYSGGAAESSFCPATTGWRNLEDSALWRHVALVLMNIMSLVRTAGQVAFEFALAVVDFFRGITTGREFWRELIYIPRRVVVNVVLREILGISVEVDVTRGVPVIHANFLGYDENSHRRGPDSRFAHFALRGIDRAIHRIWNAAHASHRRNYHLWIMADHGQEQTVPYFHEHNRHVEQAVTEVYRAMEDNDAAPKLEPVENAGSFGPQLERARWFFRQADQLISDVLGISSPQAKSEPVTMAIGPLGYVYWPGTPAAGKLDEIARKLVSDAGIPLVMAADGETTWAWNAAGKFRMPDEAGRILAPDHPFLSAVAEDFTGLCRHSDAGTFLISGWRNGQRPISFVSENGGHGGPGPKETSGFVILPADAPRDIPANGPFRTINLRTMAQTVLRRRISDARPKHPPSAEGFIRVVSYNVHSCVGLDGRLSPSRIARVLAMMDPDVIALQELDVMRTRSRFVDQAHQIANALEMQFHFHPSFEVEQEQYGNAVLSRLPMRLVQAGALPCGRQCWEPRGAIWVEIDVDGTPVQLINTHLGLSPVERQQQVDELLGPRWLGHPECHAPVILCGDLNADPRAQVYKQLCNRLADAQCALANFRPRKTWFSPFPLRRIDHLFISSDLHVNSVGVPRTQLVRVASDHLPLRVDLLLMNNADLLENDDDGGRVSSSRSQPVGPGESGDAL